MAKELQKRELRAWIEGQEAVNARRRQQVQAMTAEQKLRQISRLMGSARLFDLSRRDPGDEAVREIWQRLRRRMTNRA
jgi:hypothetical protein